MTKKKQVIFLMTDTTRKDMLGCYNPNMHTPNLDRLAAEGIRYENAYTCQPVCGPARSAIFTGTFPHTNGMVTNSIALGDNVKTIGQRLSDHGIDCGYIGKWHLDGSDYFGNGRCPDGWKDDYWYDMRRYLEELSEEDRIKSRQSSTAFEPEMTDTFTYAHRCSDRAIRFLEEYKDRDFLLVVSYDEPHGPYLCPAPYNTMYQDLQLDDNPNYEDDLSAKPLYQRLWAGDAVHKTKDELRAMSKGRALFLGCNSFADQESRPGCHDHLYRRSRLYDGQPPAGGKKLHLLQRSGQHSSDHQRRGKRRRRNRSGFPHRSGSHHHGLYGTSPSQASGRKKHAAADLRHLCAHQ